MDRALRRCDEEQHQAGGTFGSDSVEASGLDGLVYTIQSYDMARGPSSRTARPATGVYLRVRGHRERCQTCIMVGRQRSRRSIRRATLKGLSYKIIGDLGCAAGAYASV